MLEDNVLEFDPAQTWQTDGMWRPGLLRGAQNVLKVLQRDLGLPVNVDDVADFLQRPENEERINPKREELAHGDLTGKNQIEHETQNRRAHRVDGRSLDEAQAAQVLDLFQLEIEDFAGRVVQTPDLLLSQPETLHQLDVSQGLRRRTCEGGGFGDNHFLNLLDFPAEDGNQCAQDGNREEINGRNQPVYPQRINHDEDNTHQRNEKNVDDGIRQTLHIGADFLELAKRFPAALIFEDRIWQLERVADSVGINLSAEPLGDDVDVVVLEILGYARNERYTYRGCQQQTHAPKKLAGCVFAIPRRVIIDHVTEDDRIEKRKDLVDRREHEDRCDEQPVLFEIREKNFHVFKLPSQVRRADI